MTRTVLFLHSSSEHYGADRQLALLAGGLDGARWRPLAVLPDAGPLAADLSALGVEVLIRPQLAVVRRQAATPPGAAWLTLAAAADARWLRRLIAQRGVALVHSNTSVVLGGAPAARLAGIPHVWHVREIYARWGRLWPVHRRILLRGAAALPCVSQATAAQFGRGPGQAPPGTVTVIPDGLSRLPTRAPRAAARQALGLPPHAPVIALLGRVTDWKGQSVLVRALAEPELAARGAVGLLAGDAWPGAEARLAALLALARRLGVADRLVHAGFRDDVETVYGAADVVTVPSTAPDPLPNAALEAAAAGCAVVASDHGGLPEILADGHTGRLVAPGDPAALARALAALLDDPAERHTLGVAAAADVRERFAPARLTAAVQALYERVLSEAAGRARRQSGATG